MSFKIMLACPVCGIQSTIFLHAFFGEGRTEVQRYCISCKKHFMLFTSFSTALVDQVLVSSPEFHISADCKNFSKAQPSRELNKRIRMWCTIAATCKRLKYVLDVVATEFSSCAVAVDELSILIKETRRRLKSEGVVYSVDSKKGKSGTSSKAIARKVDPVWLSEVGG